MQQSRFTGDLMPLTKCYLAPSYDTELMHLFIARNIFKIDNSTLMIEDENISNMIVKLDDAIQYCFNGDIKDCKTVSAILLLYHTSFLKSKK